MSATKNLFEETEAQELSLDEILRQDAPVFDAPDDDDDEPEQPEPAPQKQKAQKQPTEKTDTMLQKEAMMWAKTVNFFTGRVCRAWAGVDNPGFHMDDDEIEDYAKSTLAYLEAGGAIASPMASFFATTAAVILPALGLAEQDRRKGVQRRKLQAMRAKPAQVNEEGKTTIETAAGPVEVSMEIEPERKRYEIVTNQNSSDFGRYQYTVKGIYIRGKKQEMAPQAVIDLTVKMKAAGATIGEINTACMELARRGDI